MNFWIHFFKLLDDLCLHWDKKPQLGYMKVLKKADYDHQVENIEQPSVLIPHKLFAICHEKHKTHFLALRFITFDLFHSSFIGFLCKFKLCLDDFSNACGNNLVLLLSRWVFIAAARYPYNTETHCVGFRRKALKFFHSRKLTIETDL